MRSTVSFATVLLVFPVPCVKSTSTNAFPTLVSTVPVLMVLMVTLATVRLAIQEPSARLISTNVTPILVKMEHLARNL
jgi:hypothetical protein